MKASEVRGGAVNSLELKPVGGSFDPLPRRDDEVEFARAGDQLLLRWRDQSWPVEPPTSSARASAVEVLDSGMPIVAWLAEVGAERVVVQTHRFVGAPIPPSNDPFEIGLDERIAEDLRKNFGVGGPVSELADWLAERVLLDGPGLPRAIVAPGRQGTMNRFLLVGRRLMVSVRRDDDRLTVERVARGGSPDRITLTLMSAPIAFKDATAAAAIASGARHALEEAVRSQDSYLRVWVEYNRLEEQAVLRRARALGALPYSSARQRPDGGWTFHLGDVSELDKRFAGLGDSDRFELEAGTQAPDFETMDTPGEDDPLTARLADYDLQKRTVDLAAPEEADDQPKPPSKGFLFLSLRGDRTRLKRRTVAEEQLRTGRCPMPWLGLLLEGRPSPRPTWRARAAESAAVRSAFGGGRPTHRQLEAIQVALNTPDIALIQGPPGTGKTKVITALQRRIAELADEGVEVSHRILLTSAQHDAVEEVVQRSHVFGLPAVKVGSRRGDDGAGIDGVEKFRSDRIEALRATLKDPPDAERLARARRAAVAVLRAPLPSTEVASQLRALLDAVGDLLPVETADRVRVRAQALERTPQGDGDPELVELQLGAARALSFGPEAFLDGGPRRARKALERLRGLLVPDEVALLQACADWSDDDTAPPFLPKVEVLRGALIDRLSAPPPPARPEMDDETQRLICDVLDEIDRRRKLSSSGDEAVLAEWLHDLESDPEAIRSALEHYTAVLAATLQQAAGSPMRAVRGIDTGSVTFETVIVDEAARSNPLDLFIPLTMAKRRVVLVGDHRQLPHMLEPDVERELSERAAGGDIQNETIEAVKHSLFRRLWNLLRRLEEQDDVKRTVTLDTQYRMHPVLGDFVSRMFYERWGDGRVSSGGVPEAYEHHLPDYTLGDRWAVAAWIDVPGGDRACWEKPGRSKSRPVEARRIAKEVRRLMEADEHLTFGVIAFYRAQVDAIGEALVGEGLAERTDSGRWRIADRWRRTTNEVGEHVERLRVGTVDAFQGKEFDVVFLSVTRSNDLPAATDEQQRRKYGHLMLDNRLCVAMSRQHRLLVAVGDLDFIRAAEPLRPLQEFIKLCEGEHGVVR